MIPAARLSKADLVRLGERARQRREQLGIKRAELARITGIAHESLFQYEKQLPLKPRDLERAWEEQLLVPAGWLRNLTIAATPPIPVVTPKFDFTGETVAEEINAVCRWYSRKLPGARTTSAEQLNPSELRMAEIMAQRFGVRGEEVSSLEAIGIRHGLTRERIRQIEAKFLERLSKEPVQCPSFDDLKSFASTHLPLSVEGLDELLRAKLGDSLSVRGADRFSRLVLQKELLRFRLPTPNRPFMMVVPEDMSEDVVVKHVQALARREVSLISAAQADLLAGVASRDLERSVTSAEVVQLCRLVPGFEWIAPDENWFWFGPKSARRLRGVLRKLFSISERALDISEIHQAMAGGREALYQNNEKIVLRKVEVPMSVLQIVVSKMPGVRSVRFDDYVCDNPSPEVHALAPGEQAIVGAIRKYGGVIANQDLVAEVAEAGISIHGLAMALGRSPIFLRLEPGIWAIRGVRFKGECYDKAIARLGYAAVVPVTKSDDGWYVHEVTLSPRALGQYIWMVPASLAHVMTPGDYTIEGADTVLEFRHVDGVGTLHRYRAPFKALGIGSGDTIRISVRVTEMTIRVEKIRGI